MNQKTQTEVIAFCSGKGGTGKTLLCSCLGYSLIRGGQRVLMIDGDPATDGLSLFLLGPKGMKQVVTFSDQNTFVGALLHFKATKSTTFQARPIHRRGDGDHGVTYNALISGRGLYGDKAFMGQVVPDLDQATFRGAIRDLFGRLRDSAEYDYVLVDTRGGFAFESADICALADSFIIVTEPDFTSFYQDRNLYSSIGAAAAELESPSLLRAIIVNKAVDSVPQPGIPYLDTLETSFRNELVREFKVTYKETYPVPVSIDALMAYKVQKIPYISSPESSFCSATLAAFSDILQIVTSRWSIEQVDHWNELISKITAAVVEKQKVEEKRKEELEAEKLAVQHLREEYAERGAKLETLSHEFATSSETQRAQYEEKISSLQRELGQQSRLYEREYERTQMLIGKELPARERYGLEQAAKAASDGMLSTRKKLTYWILGGVLVAIAIAAIAYYVHLSNTNARELAVQAQNSKSQLNELRNSSQQNNAPVVPPPPDPPPKLMTKGAIDTLPAVPSITGDNVNGNYGVLLSADNDLTPKVPGGNSGAYEAQLALQIGYVSTSMYENGGLFVTAVMFDTPAKARAAQKTLSQNARWRTAEVVSINTWCPAKAPEAPVSIKGFSIPLWKCSSASAKK